jgi:hypothetical protein
MDQFHGSTSNAAAGCVTCGKQFLLALVQLFEAIFKRSLPVVRIIRSRGVFTGQLLKNLVVENVSVPLVIASKLQHLHTSNAQCPRHEVRACFELSRLPPQNDISLLLDVPRRIEIPDQRQDVGKNAVRTTGQLTHKMFGRDGIYHVKVVLSAKYEKVSAGQVACLKSISTRTLGLSRQFRRSFWKVSCKFRFDRTSGEPELRIFLGNQRLILRTITFRSSKSAQREEPFLMIATGKQSSRKIFSWA